MMTLILSKRLLMKQTLSLLLITIITQFHCSYANQHILFTSAVVSPKSPTSTTKENTIISGGLINLGNTCYLNAQLECAYHIPKVRNLILDLATTNTATDNDNDDDSDDSNIGFLSLQQVFKSMYIASQRGNGNLSQTPSVSTNVLCRNLGINVYEQQDSQEFWKLLLPELNHNLLTELYKGEYETYITALDGSGRERKRKEVFLDLSLDVSNFDNVHDSLEEMFTSGEVLSVREGNGWRPEKGAEKVDALKGSTIAQSGLPNILQLHLMRFSYDVITGGMSKINDRFVFSKQLDLTSICQEEGRKDKAIFDLQSIVVHAGDYGSGHYYAYVRPDISKNKWYRYDDDRVTKVTFKMVKDDAFGGHIVMKNRNNNPEGVQRGILHRLFARNPRRYGWGGEKSSAYMLQYVKRSEIPSLYN